MYTYTCFLQHTYSFYEFTIPKFDDRSIFHLFYSPINFFFSALFPNFECVSLFYYIPKTETYFHIGFLFRSIKIYLDGWNTILNIKFLDKQFSTVLSSFLSSWKFYTHFWWKITVLRYSTYYLHVWELIGTICRMINSFYYGI